MNSMNLGTASVVIVDINYMNLNKEKIFIPIWELGPIGFYKLSNIGFFSFKTFYINCIICFIIFSLSIILGELFSVILGTFLIAFIWVFSIQFTPITREYLIKSNQSELLSIIPVILPILGLLIILLNPNKMIKLLVSKNYLKTNYKFHYSDTKNNVYDKMLEDTRHVESTVARGDLFEEFCAVLMSNMGYICIIKGGSGDQGVDIYARKNIFKWLKFKIIYFIKNGHFDKSQITGKNIAIQCKHMSSVGTQVIQIIKGNTFDPNSIYDQGIVMTTGVFTKKAIDAISGNEILIFNGNKVKELSDNYSRSGSYSRKRDRSSCYTRSRS